MLTATRFCVRCGTRFDKDATPASCPQCDKSTARTSAGASGPAGYLRIGPVMLPAWLVLLVAIVVGAGGFGWYHLTHAIGAAERNLASATLPTALPTTLSTGLPTAATNPATPPPSTPAATTPAISPTPRPTPTLNAIQTARLGQCFDNTGTDKAPDLVRDSCQTGTFRVVSVKHGTTDPAKCDNIPRDTWNFPYGQYDLVLCTTYLNGASTAYSANTDSCVYGPNSPGAWQLVRCQTGNFRVVERFPGTTDTGKCPKWPGADENLTFPVRGHPALDALLCLSMNYPDAAGHATVRECLLMSGTVSKPAFARVSSCAAANVFVTNRTQTYDDPSFCGSDAAAWWEPRHFPKLAYTICYRDLR